MNNLLALDGELFGVVFLLSLSGALLWEWLRPGRSVFNGVAIALLALLLSACAAQDRLTTLPAVDAQTRAAHGEVTIALLGATGMVGGFVLDQALEQGYRIRALARTPQKLAPYEGRIEVVQGDARDRSTIAELLRGSDVVMSALGPVRGDGVAAKMLNTVATGHIVEEMRARGLERYILVSGAAVTLPGDDRDITGALVQKSAAITLPSALVDKQAEYELLRDSALQWTAVRCPVIRAEPYLSAPVASLATPASFTVRAGELAHFMLEQIDSAEYIRASPFLGSR